MIDANVINYCEKDLYCTDSFNDECQKLFDFDFLSAHRLLRLGLLNELRNCRFRSFCWRVYLGILNENIEQWQEKILIDRCMYEDIRHKYIIDPHQNSIIEDHPLSLKIDSRWNQYFQSHDIMRVIREDFSRTFPDTDLFNDTAIRTSMINVLYCHSQMFSFSYQQGFLEILAPIVFVLHCDYVAYKYSSESYHLSGSTKNVGKILFDSEFLEHDAYSIFSRLIRFVEPWYDSSINPLNLTEARPFSRTKEWTPESSIEVKLATIHHNILRRQDLDLYLHFEHLNMLPQMFALRWFQALFAGEFSLEDVVIVWDVLLAAGEDVCLAEHIYVSMLVHMRDYLLVHDLAACLDHVMHVPATVDVCLVVDHALHSFDPGHYDRPTVTSRHREIALHAVHRRPRRTARNITVVGLESIANKLSGFIGKTPPVDPGELGVASNTLVDPVDLSDYLQIRVPSERRHVMRLCAVMVDESLASIGSLTIDRAVATLQRTRQLLADTLAIPRNSHALELPLLDLHTLNEEVHDSGDNVTGSRPGVGHPPGDTAGAPYFP